MVIELREQNKRKYVTVFIQSQQIDITDYAVAIVGSVRDICHQGSLNPQDALKTPNQRVTLNQFVDIFKVRQDKVFKSGPSKVVKGNH